MFSRRKKVKFHENPFISLFLRKPRIVRHSSKNLIFIIFPKHPFYWPNWKIVLSSNETFYSGYHTSAKRFSLWFGGRQSTATMLFTRCPREDSFLVSWALRGTCRRLSRFAIFCYRIWHRFMSRLRGVRICWMFVMGKLKLSTYWQTVSYNYISFLITRSQIVSSEFLLVVDSVG